MPHYITVPDSHSYPQSGEGLGFVGSLISSFVGGGIEIYKTEKQIGIAKRDLRFQKKRLAAELEIAKGQQKIREKELAGEIYIAQIKGFQTAQIGKWVAIVGVGALGIVLLMMAARG